jgi:hypothetical protein
MGLTWGFKALPLTIWVAWPGFLLSWGMIILLRGNENWPQDRFDLIGIILATIGNAAFYSWISFIVMRRKANKEAAPNSQ